MKLRKIKNLLQKSEFIKHMYKRYKKNKNNYRIKNCVNEGGPVKIVFGASGVFDEGWIPTDMDNLNLLDNADWKKYFKPDSIDAMLAEHVWEHLTTEEGSIALENCYKYLKHGGYFRIAVPDGCHPDQKYIDYVKVNGSGLGSDDHKVLYTYKTFKAVLETAGFIIKPLEYFDENGEFHFEEWGVDQGKIHRSKRFDVRNQDGFLSYTSIIVDAYKK